VKQSLALALAYYVVSQLNLRLTVEQLGLAAFWIASGISFAFFVRNPPREWPKLTVAVFVACVIGNWQAGYDLGVNLGMALANGAEPVVGAACYLWMERRLGGRRRGVSMLPLMAAAALASVFGATIGAATWHLLAGSNPWTTGLHWLFSDLVAIQSIAPLLLVMYEPRAPRLAGEAGVLETCLVFAAQACAIVVSFVILPELLQVQGAVFVVQCFLLWGGLRLRRREAAGLAVLHSTAILGVTAFGLGPFSYLAQSVDARFTGLQIFLSISTAFYLALFDTVQQVRAGQRLIASNRDELRQLLDCSPDGVFVHDTAGVIVDVNERTLQMYRCRREDIIGRHPADFSAGRENFDFAAAKGQLERAGHGDLPQFEWRAKRLDGSTFWAEVALRSARIGDEPRVVAMVRDVDRRKNLEERLRHAQKLEIIGRLTGGIVHDFRNISQALNGLIGFLKEDIPADSPARETLGLLDSTALRARELTEKLLAFSRKSEKGLGTMSVHACLSETITLLQRTLPRSVSITAELQALRDSIDGDPAILPNAFVNLALNARDAMPQGGTLRITTKNRSLDAAFCTDSIAPIEPAEFIEVTFSDDGQGIALEHMERLFQPFFTTKEAGKGTGLGLASVLACMQEHHGTVDVESNSGRGTAVHLFFPVRP
jgi:PAS domain S-box-containing protein